MRWIRRTERVLYHSKKPALSKSWHSGSFTGFRARGGYTVDVQWKNDRLKQAKIVADREGVCRLRYDGKILLVQDENGNEIDVDFEDGVTSFHAQPGAAYTFS